MILLKNKIGFGAVIIWPIIFAGLFALPSEIKAPIGDVPEAAKKNISNNVFPVADVLKEKNKPVELMDVLFISQAPLGKWNDLRQEHGCEEASALMAMAWARGIAELSPQESEKEIIAISDYELGNYGTYFDTSAEDTVKWIFNDYFRSDNVKVKYGIGVEDIKNELLKGNIVLIPVNGRKLKNPFYTPPGPIEHMIVAVDYDGVKKEFIANDPGTKHGKNFRYKEDVLNNALMDYSTSVGGAEQKTGTAMIVVSR